MMMMMMMMWTSVWLGEYIEYKTFNQQAVLCDSRLLWAETA